MIGWFANVHTSGRENDLQRRRMATVRYPVRLRSRGRQRQRSKKAKRWLRSIRTTYPATTSAHKPSVEADRPDTGKCSYVMSAALIAYHVHSDPYG